MYEGLSRCTTSLPYHSLPIIRPPILHTTLSLMRGGGLYSNNSVSLDYTHPQHVDVAKSHDDLPVANLRNSSNIGHVPQEFFQVCC